LRPVRADGLAGRDAISRFSFTITSNDGGFGFPVFGFFPCGFPVFDFRMCGFQMYGFGLPV
jgi:hypothetical protein